MNDIIVNGMSFSIPLFIIAVGGIYSERSGVTNLALEGFMGAGAFFGAVFTALTAGMFAATSQLPMYISLFVAMIGGALYAIVHAVLCIKFKANQVISGVVVNILAMALTDFLTSQINESVLGQSADKFILNVAPRITIGALSGIPVLGGFFTNVYLFEFIIIAVAIVAWYVMYKTKFGMRLRACGDNPYAVDAAGCNVARTQFIAVLVSGALSGLGGMCFAYSVFGNYSTSIYAGYGYLAIAALIFGNWKIPATLGACLLFGFARAAGYSLIQYLSLPGTYSDLIMTLPYVLTLLLLVFFSKNNRAPRALGEIYDKGKR
ncbi:MAG: ABC transporter permease [Firmicutes bacterium]|nr:ABC transporter permease [Bacillota bacterium]